MNEAIRDIMILVELNWILLVKEIQINLLHENQIRIINEIQQVSTKNILKGIQWGEIYLNIADIETI